MSEAPQQAFVLSHGDKRLRAIARGLFDGPIKELAPVGLSARSAPPGPIDQAMATATRGNTGPVKRLVLAGQWRWIWQRLKSAPRSYVIVWNGIKGHRYLVAQAAKALNHVPVYLEEAPFAGRLSVDFRGVNAGNSLPRHPEFYMGAGHVADMGELRHGIEARASRRDDVDQRDADRRLGADPFIFAPLQVPQDSQITVYGDWINSVEHMVKAICTAADHLPDGWHLRVKEHPSARRSLSTMIQGSRVVLDNTTDTFQQVAASRGVVTVNSSVGLFSMLWDKPVVTLGEAFWGWAPIALRARSQAELASAFANPAWEFDPDARRAFVGYLTERYFPLETDVVAGRWPLASLPFALERG